MADQAGKRRLPLWKSDVVAVVHSEQNGETIRNPKPNTMTRISRKVSMKVKKCETKRRKVNTTHKDDSELSGKRLLSFSDNVDKIETLTMGEDDDDDEELTMEDLMSIAKEYTGTNETNQREKYIIDTPEVNLKLRASVKNDNESESYFNTTTNVKPREKLSFHKPPEKKPCEKTVAAPPILTGDTAQDMLNLFLGPLLQKPQMEEKKLDLSNKEEDIGPGLKNYVSDVSFPLEKRKCSLKDKDIGPGLKKYVSDVSVPLEKRKCSLKDKVAMLLQ